MMSWTHKNIVILGKDELPYVLKNYKITDIISLYHESGLEELKKIIPDDINHHIEIFNDIDQADLRYAPSSFTPPSEEHVKNVIDFVDEHCHSKSKIIIHCVAGIGRSPGMALALYIKSGLDELSAIERMLTVRYTAWPNNLIVEHIDSMFGTKLLKAVRAWKQHAAKLDFKMSTSEENILNNFNEFKDQYDT